MTESDELRIVQNVADHVERTFDVDIASGNSIAEAKEQLHATLVERIVELLTKNPERLMSILYRIDVRESLVNEIFSKALPPEVPYLLADAIIERQMQKVRSRGQS